jgi:hypothetical protein
VFSYIEYGMDIKRVTQCDQKVLEDFDWIKQATFDLAEEV